jgi:predicted  nucleic acid-binding Zn-ribbon protein
VLSSIHEHCQKLVILASDAISCQKDVTSCIPQAGQLKTEVDAFKEDLGTARMRIHHLDEEKAELRYKETQLQAKLSSAQAKMDLLETECNELRQEVRLPLCCQGS